MTIPPVQVYYFDRHDKSKLTVIKSRSKVIILQRFLLYQLLHDQKHTPLDKKNTKLPLSWAKITECCRGFTNYSAKFNSVVKSTKVTEKL